KHDSCTRCATKGAPGTPGDASFVTTTSSVSGTVPWSITLSGNLRSFLIGSFTAAADVLGTVQVSPDRSTWPSTEIHYGVNDACDAFGNCTEVPQFPSGSTGVVDLGPVNFATPGGPFWGGSLTFQFDVNTGGDIITSCRVGYGGEITVHPGG